MKVTLSHETLITMVKTAIECKKQIYIAYTDRHGKNSLRFVEPVEWLENAPNGLGILTKCHEREGSYRHFKIRNIDRIIITDYDFCWVNPLDKEERVS